MLEDRELLGSLRSNLRVIESDDPAMLSSLVAHGLSLPNVLGSPWS